MRIALFSDIHANLPAFETFLADLDSRKVDAVYCLGDMIGYNIWPNEIIAEIRRRGIATLAGNHDQKSKGYAYELVSANNRQYLNTLPSHIKLEYQLNNDQLNIVLAHGSTRSINEYVLEDTDEAYVLDMMIEAKADILCVGHSHKPYHRIIGEKHVINIGSVGKPKDGDPRGCYVLLTLENDIQVEFVRFCYNIEKAVKAIEGSPLADDLADRLRKAN
ncbi:metallophosphoesterase family protein [Mucilaginibacter rubeus]|uniref:Phosphoesterase n=2 Tax=Mucilaginibacter rubeus TaxID=2027860 RepID=A0A364WWB1_9SPHI|nr:MULTISPECIES: metallophosphoesterase family protein [Mucilaginibacter]QEM06109.1 metallophosphoesterase family protein [Mucilaginibacter rubeus]QEM13626.1 metallophosphoesterase family protein [Mucilaginibacter rubeus]QEM18689.1 metallophosphoesterase family protein [Mucilaginibacter gossypii]QTE36316.1 metallophosphoesterase family protein [Mucilaginibacter gossypii]QTE44769.1 metallophosphoesterase family protein [Mucilaginibacter rubeus]